MLRKLLILILMFFFSFSLFSISWQSFDGSEEGTFPDVKVLYSGVDKTVIDITIHGVWVGKVERKGVSFDYVAIPQEEFLREVGKPQVPSIGRLIAIPNGKKFKCNVVDSSYVELENLTLFPAQPQPNRCSDKKNLPFMFNEKFYTKDVFYPGYLVKGSNPKVLRDIRNIRLGVYPLQYNPLRGIARFYTHLVVEIDYYGVDNRANVKNENLPIDPSYEVIYRNTFINYSSFFKGKALSDREKILIFVADDLYDSISDFVDWKEKCGYEVFVEKMSDVGATVDNIKNKIVEYYNDPDRRPAYVIMVGDENTIPPDYRSTANGNAASDYTYELMDSDDDPDLIVGRIVASSAAEAEIQFDKIIHYEENPDTGGSADWYTKCVGIASNEGSDPSDAEYIDQITTVLINHTYTYRDQFLQGDGTATSSNINSALNEGRSWLTYVGHGSITSWGSTNDTYDVNTIDQLSNGYKMPIIIDVACENGHYDGNDCFAEKWMRAGSVGSPKGAVGIYAGTVSVSWDPPAIMAKGVAIRHYDDPEFTFGGSCIAGQLYLEANWNNQDEVVDNMEWYTIFGDPSMFMRTDVPESLNVTHDSIFPLGATTFSVNVKDSSGNPVEGARVYAYSDAEDDVKSYGLTDSNGNVTLQFSQGPNFTGTLRIYVTGYNLAPNVSTAQITGDSTCTPPSTISVTNSGANDVLISWNGGSGDSYMIYRAVGDCSSSSFEVIADGVSGTSYHDTTVQGGYTYAYKVRSVCGGTPGTETSGCESVVASGDCNLEPTFDGLESIDQPLEASCKLILNWNPGSSNCPNNPDITYKVYRSTAGSNDFSLIASGITGTSYTDTTVSSGITYQYKVHAVDGAGNEDSNDVVLSSTPLGPITTIFSDDMESTEPNGWSHEAAQGTDDWAYTTDEYHSATHSWFATDASSVKDDYLYTPTISISSSNSELYFWHKYDMETGYDGCVLEISTDGGSTWQDMENYITQGGYDATISSSYNSPIAGRRAWTGLKPWTQVIVDLSNFAGNDVIFRFRITSDSSVNKTGWWIDDVEVKESENCSSAQYDDGDLNEDGSVNSQDAVILANYLSGNISQGEGGFVAPLEKADMNGDGVVDAIDLVLILIH